jgi:glutaredoxin
MSDTKTQTHLYWATGCTSCLRAKEFLERNDVEFESHNIAEDMSMLDEMEAQGLPRQVPVIKRGEEWADAQDLDAVARIAEIEYEAEPLPVDELYRRLEIALDAIEQYIDQIPVEKIDGPIANRPRSVGQLVFHSFSISESFLEHQDGEPLKTYKPEPEWANRSLEALRTYGQHIQARLDDWHEHEAEDCEWSEQADVYYGDPSLHEYFERTVWHTGQHARQLEWIVEERFGLQAEPSLDPELWEGLPMPEKVWNKDGGDGTAPDDRVNILEATQSD